MNNETITLKNIYLIKNNIRFGPYNESEVLELLRTEQFTLNNLACAEGMKEWKRLGFIFQDNNRQMPFVSSPTSLSQISVVEVGLFIGVFIFALIIPMIAISLITQTLFIPGPLFWIFASGISGWAVQQKLKKKMGKMLGREVKSNLELNSISNWIEIASKTDRVIQK